MVRKEERKAFAESDATRYSDPLLDEQSRSQYPVGFKLRRDLSACPDIENKGIM